MYIYKKNLLGKPDEKALQFSFHSTKCYHNNKPYNNNSIINT